MTNKQNLILEHALELFATNGFDATSTKRIAEQAGVSEGLIFRHFTNKEGLLNAIVSYGTNKASSYFEKICSLTSPKEVIIQSLSLSKNIDSNEENFWRLMYALKWQRGFYNNDAFESLKIKLVWAFRELGFEHPELETRIIEVWIDGLATERLLKKSPNNELIEIILNKYNLTCKK
jgi:AcrR family transcriptional regulator